MHDRNHLGVLLAIGSIGLLAACSSGDGGSGANDGGAGAGGGSGGTGNASGGGGTPAAGGTGNPGDPEPPDMNGITAAHNLARASVSPPAATPIPPLGWSSTIAQVAQSHAGNCVFEHSKGSYGENLYASTNSSTPQQVVASWMEEESSYDYATGTCSSICGHYTQVVWAKSLKLGCGVANCASGSPFGSGAWQLWVCNYDPPGNFSGQKPY